MRGQRGQGLIETIVTVFIISGAAIALLQFQNYLAYSNTVTQQQSYAIQIALSEIETLRDFSTIAQYNAIASSSSIVNGPNATYTMTWTITNYNNPTYATINVNVAWTDRYNVAQSITLTTDVAGLDPSYSAQIM